jgi:phage gp46-like protein
MRCIRHTVTHVTQIAEQYSNEDLDPICPRTTRSTCQSKSSRAVIRMIKIDLRLHTPATTEKANSDDMNTVDGESTNSDDIQRP